MEKMIWIGLENGSHVTVQRQNWQGKRREIGYQHWPCDKASRIDVREESSIFSVFYQPASASMKIARDISVMSTNLDARRTQQVSFMLLFSCLWPLMGSIQYVNNMIKLKAHSRVCVCMLAAVACMNGRDDDDDDHVYNFVHCDEML